MDSRFANPDERPYFLRDEPTTVAGFRRALAEAQGPEKGRLLGKLLREARDPDVWAFTTEAEVRAHWAFVERHLGRRRAFWTWLLEQWAMVPRENSA